MGSVRRTRPEKAANPEIAPVGTAGLPAEVVGAEIHKIIRSNLSSVKGCYLTMSRQGVARSGKAIVTFAIGEDGRPKDVRVEAPSFQGTVLPSCISSQVSFWAFPKSQKGGGVVSYPFVFVGG